MKKILYYFAYGRNMSMKQITNRLDYPPTKKGTAILKDYKLVFNCGHEEHSYANITPCKGAKVEGVLYQLDNWEIIQLDRYEGYPLNYIKEFFFIEDKLCFAYVGTKRFLSYAKPSLEYLNYLIEGAKENLLSNTYNTLIDMKDKKEYAKPKRNYRSFYYVNGVKKEYDEELRDWVEVN